MGKIWVKPNKTGIYSEYIYNRYDLWEGDFCFDVFQHAQTNRVFEILIKGEDAYVGCWLRRLSPKDFSSLAKTVFRKHKQVKRVYGEANLIETPFSEKKIRIVLELPRNREELNNRVSRKHRADYRHCMNTLSGRYGPMSFLRYPSGDFPKELLDFYFVQKKESYGIDYGLTPDEYISKYHVSNIYALFFGAKCVSVLLSCEQTEIVYLENLTYDASLKEYSVGTIAYMEYLVSLGDSGRKLLYLGGVPIRINTASEVKKSLFIIVPMRGALSFA